VGGDDIAYINKGTVGTNDCQLVDEYTIHLLKRLTVTSVSSFKLLLKTYVYLNAMSIMNNQSDGV
jgi:hypothetical protein